MSESSFPFEGGTSVATAPPPLPLQEEVSAAPDRGKLLAIGGAATVLVLAVVGYFLFFAGGSDPAPATPSATTVKPAAPAPVADPADTSSKPAKLNQKNFGRDPFKALIVEAPDTTVPAVGTVGGAGSTTTTGTSAGTSTGTAGGSTASGSTDAGTSTPAQTTSHSFRVVSVAPNNSAVDVKVDGKVYRNLHAGEVFATYFKVVLISGTTNAFQYGEEKFNVLGTKRLTIA